MRQPALFPYGILSGRSSGLPGNNIDDIDKPYFMFLPLQSHPSNARLNFSHFQSPSFAICLKNTCSSTPSDIASPPSAPVP